MRKQILILISIGISIVGLFLLVNHSNPSSGTLFNVDTEELKENEISYTDEVEMVKTSTEEKESNLHEKAFVDVQGEVVNPGVFEVDSNVRVGYLIALAGGVTEYANTRSLNQAARIYDEMVIFVPHVDDIIEVGNEVNSSNGNTGISNGSGLISLSNASSLELQSLPGIGPTLSANIIAHREANGIFLTVDDLIDVAGIGAGIMENIREFVKP